MPPLEFVQHLDTRNDILVLLPLVTLTRGPVGDGGKEPPYVSGLVSSDSIATGRQSLIATLKHLVCLIVVYLVYDVSDRVSLRLGQVRLRPGNNNMLTWIFLVMT